MCSSTPESLDALDPTGPRQVALGLGLDRRPGGVPVHPEVAGDRGHRGVVVAQRVDRPPDRSCGQLRAGLGVGMVLGPRTGRTALLAASSDPLVPARQHRATEARRVMEPHDTAAVTHRADPALGTAGQDFVGTRHRARACRRRGWSRRGRGRPRHRTIHRSGRTTTHRTHTYSESLKAFRTGCLVATDPWMPRAIPGLRHAATRRDLNHAQLRRAPKRSGFRQPPTVRAAQHSLNPINSHGDEKTSKTRFERIHATPPESFFVTKRRRSGRRAAHRPTST